MTRHFFPPSASLRMFCKSESAVLVVLHAYVAPRPKLSPCDPFHHVDHARRRTLTRNLNGLFPHSGSRAILFRKKESRAPQILGNVPMRVRCPARFVLPKRGERFPLGHDRIHDPSAHQEHGEHDEKNPAEKLLRHRRGIGEGDKRAEQEKGGQNEQHDTHGESLVVVGTGKVSWSAHRLSMQSRPEDRSGPLQHRQGLKADGALVRHTGTTSGRDCSLTFSEAVVSAGVGCSLTGECNRVAA